MSTKEEVSEADPEEFDEEYTSEEEIAPVAKKLKSKFVDIEAEVSQI